jgi:hypothetical protein
MVIKKYLFLGILGRPNRDSYVLCVVAQERMGSYFDVVEHDPQRFDYGENTMHGNVVGLVAAAALLASVGIANAKGPVKLTDGQLDKITAGASASSINASATAELNSLVAASTNTVVALNGLTTNTLNFFNAFLTTPLAP